MSQYPEHDKLGAVSEASQAIGEFLDNCGYTLCKPEGNFFHPKGIPTILAEYFGIDQKKLEAEKRQVLDEIRPS